MTTSTSPTLSSEEFHARFEAFCANMRKQFVPVAKAMAIIQERVQESLTALSTVLVDQVGPHLRRCGLLPALPRRTTKAERRAAKRHLAIQRRTEPDACRYGIAATARALVKQQERTHG